jgi:hypothetical protein
MRERVSVIRPLDVREDGNEHSLFCVLLGPQMYRGQLPKLAVPHGHQSIPREANPIGRAGG